MEGTKKRHLLGLVCATALIGSLLGPTQALAGGSMVATPNPLNFGNVTVGTPATQPITLTNTSANLITNDSILGANVAEFATDSACDGQSPTNANPCTLHITFTPSAVGMFSAVLSIPHNGTNSPVTVPLTGTGVAPTPPPLITPITLQPTTTTPPRKCKKGFKRKRGKCVRKKKKKK